MANANKGQVSLEAGGKTYLLQYTTNAMCELEDAVGKTISQIVDDLSDDKNPPGIRQMRVLLWAALTENHEMTLKEAGRLCDAVGIAEVGTVIGTAFQAAFPEAEDGPGKKKASKA